MKLLVQFGLCCLLASGAFAQRGGGHGGGGGHVGSAGGVRGGGFRGGLGRGFGNRGFYGRGLYGRGYYGPWAYGGYYWPYLGDFGDFDYGGGPDYDYSYPSTYSYGGGPGGSNVTVVYGPPAQPVYPVVVEQTAHPVMHEYHQPEDYGLPSEQESHPVVYLIAFNDHVIHPATTYWVEGGTLHYLDMDHKPKQAPLSSVDGDFSAQLNRERHVPFHLPEP